MKSSKDMPKFPLNFLVIFHILCFQTITTNSRTSTLWKLNSDKTKIVEGESSDSLGSHRTGLSTVPKFVTQDDPLFNIITSTEHYGSSWVKHDELSYCADCDSQSENSDQVKVNSTNPDFKLIDSSQNSEDNHELSCGKPINFTFYDNLVGVMHRDKHPPLVEPEAMIEFIRKFKFKAGKTFDLELVENKLKQIKKEKPKTVGTFHQLGNFWRIKGEPRRAIECFRKALAISPHNADVLLNLAKVLFHLQYLDDAIYLTRRSLEVAPPEKGAWPQYFTLGEIFKAYGHYQEAQIHFRHTLDLNPDYEPAIKYLKEMEDMPSSPMHFYTLIIIICLVIAVLLVILTSLENSENVQSKSQKQFHKSLRGMSWSSKKSRKINM